MAIYKLIKNGRLVTHSHTFKADILIKNEKIFSISKDIKVEPFMEVIDANGLLVLPGAIDPHVHLQLPVSGTVSSDDFDIGTKAAARGGVTTIIDYSTQLPGNSLIESIIERKNEADDKVNIDYSLHAGITDWKCGIPAREIREVIKLGITSFKMFMIYRNRGWMADDGDLYEALKLMGKHKALLEVHAENAAITEALTEYFVKSNLYKKYGAYSQFLTRPSFTEGEAIQRVITINKYAKGLLYIVHMSTKHGYFAVKKGLMEGVRVIAETCPQYLYLTAEKYKKKNGHLYETCPPIRTRADNIALTRGLIDGTIKCLGTDTCTFKKAQKDVWNGRFDKTTFGIPGVETFMPLMFHYFKKHKDLNLNKLVSIVALNNARVFGLFPKKGILAPGSDADIVLWDENKKLRLEPKNLTNNCDWSPYSDIEVKGFPVLTILRGNIIVKNGKFIESQAKKGKFIKRKFCACI